MAYEKIKAALSALPYYKERQGFPFAFDHIQKLPETGRICVFYGVVEESMMNERGFLALFENENAEKPFFLYTAHSLPRQTVICDESERFLFVQVYFRDTISGWHYALLILDLEKECYYLKRIRKFDPLCTVTHPKKHLFLHPLCGRINLKAMKSRPFSKLDGLADQVKKLKKPLFGG